MTMRETERLADQLQRAHRGNAWHGPALDELLQDLTAAQAAARPLPQAHTIWEIVYHLTAWHDAVYRRLQGEAVEPEGTADWPPVNDHSEGAWLEALAALQERQARLHAAILALRDGDLDLPVPDQPYTRYVMLHGLIQHDLYHAGQIALLRKAVTGPAPS